ncbi:hypothetical protein HPB49_012815 [Dermacentor silvarum]|uniref:Uncharacterized protein n=1 Tax=Dermacentor silvarum TaxID=543639 RepID=A0ACB8C9E1_DERSI|nr:hypothetical protein HPB49_012815 [Dermacentor silvarum]
MAHAFECAFFGTLVAANLALGLYFSLRSAPSRPNTGVTKVEVFLGSRTLRYLPLAASSVASLFSSTGLIGFPAHFYAYGWHVLWLSLTPLLLFPLATRLFVPLLYKLGVTSIFEYLRFRFNASISLTACVIYIILTKRQQRERQDDAAKMAALSGGGGEDGKMAPAGYNGNKYGVRGKLSYKAAGRTLAEQSWRRTCRVLPNADHKIIIRPRKD